MEASRDLARSMKASIESVWDPFPFLLKARRMDLLMLPGRMYWMGFQSERAPLRQNARVENRVSTYVQYCTHTRRPSLQLQQTDFTMLSATSRLLDIVF